MYRKEKYNIYLIYYCYFIIVVNRVFHRKYRKFLIGNSDKLWLIRKLSSYTIQKSKKMHVFSLKKYFTLKIGTKKAFFMHSWGNEIDHYFFSRGHFVFKF